MRKKIFIFIASESKKLKIQKCVDCRKKKFKLLFQEKIKKKIEEKWKTLCANVNQLNFFYFRFNTREKRKNKKKKLGKSFN